MHDPSLSPAYSRLGLGTVQFGQAYGINNTTGQVSFDQVCEILLTAHEHGITFLDTSRNYGSSEEVIGKALKEIKKDFTICTKLDLPKNFKELDDARVLQEVDASVDASLQALCLDSIPLLLLHTYDYYAFKDRIIWHRLVQLQQLGRIEHLGISIANGPHEALKALEDNTISALQIPFNVLDQRWNTTGFFAHAKHIRVITRSAYLQGLLLMDIERAAQRLALAKPYLMRFHEIAEAWGLGVKELAFSYVLKKKEIDVTIVGVDTPEQLKENIELLSKPALTDSQMAYIEQAFKDVPLEVVNPSLWNVI